MTGPGTLFEYEDNWPTSMGAWFAGEGAVLRGRDVLHDFDGYTWTGFLLYAITGREFTERQVELFEGLWRLSASYPEPRLWNNRVAALAGTARSTPTLAVSAAIAVTEASVYGHRPLVWAMDFLQRAVRWVEDGGSLREFVEQELHARRTIGGYGRPMTGTDERIGPVMALARKLGCADGKFVRVAFGVEEILLRGRWRLRMNIAALSAALLADQGMSLDEFHQYSVLSFSAGMFPCYSDARAKPEGAFFPLRCDRIDYRGPVRRRWEDDMVNDTTKAR